MIDKLKAFKGHVLAPFAYVKTHLPDFIMRTSQDFANGVFKASNETNFVILFFNAIAILSSHINQIKGLKKSDRENKDYLISQERKELFIDFALTLVPPLVLSKYLHEKLKSGMFTTKEFQQKYKELAATFGVADENLYDIGTRIPLVEEMDAVGAKAIERILKHSHRIPRSIVNKLVDKKEAFDKVLHKRDLEFPRNTVETITHDFDNQVLNFEFIKGDHHEVLDTFRNRRATAEFNGQINGLLIGATILYTIVASNIIMPYLKNKWSNREHRKELAKLGETSESMRRKKRFEFSHLPANDESSKNFADFSRITTHTQLPETGNLLAPVNKKNDTFKDFNSYSKNIYKSSGLKI